LVCLHELFTSIKHYFLRSLSQACALIPSVASIHLFSPIFWESRYPLPFW